MRARATTLPSSSAAIAFTDDVPMSIPTVTLDVAMLSALDGRFGSSARRLRERREHRVVQRPVGAHEAAAVHVGAAVDRAPPAAGLLDDRARARRCPRGSRSDRSRCRPRLRRRARAARSRRRRGTASTGARGRSACRRCRRRRTARAVSQEKEICASSSAETADTVIALAVAERAEAAAGPPTRCRTRAPTRRRAPARPRARARSASPRSAARARSSWCRRWGR